MRQVHQQNGRAERLNRTLLEKAQSMRLEACLPDSWWEFAFATATHVYNHTPIKRLRRSSQVKNLKYRTSMSLVVEHMCTSPVKFTQINLHRALNS